MLSMMTVKSVGSDVSQLRVQPTTGLNLAARSAANRLMACIAVSFCESLRETERQEEPKEILRTHIKSSSENGKLTNPTSCCRFVLLVSSGISPVLVDRPSSSQSATPKAFASVAPHRVLRVFNAYKVAGKKPDVQVSGIKSSQVPGLLTFHVLVY